VEGFLRAAGSGRARHHGGDRVVGRVDGVHRPPAAGAKAYGRRCGARGRRGGHCASPHGSGREPGPGGRGGARRAALGAAPPRAGQTCRARALRAQPAPQGIPVRAVVAGRGGLHRRPQRRLARDANGRPLRGARAAAAARGSAGDGGARRRDHDVRLSWLGWRVRASVRRGRPQARSRASGVSGGSRGRPAAACRS
jgi:hypothetical protein